MKKQFALGAAMFLFGIAAVGCQQTAEGAKQDTANNTAAVKDAADQTAIATKQAADKAAEATKAAADRAVSATQKATKNIGDNLDVRPKIKEAIVNDKELNNTKNEVHVNAEGGIVTLTGHVMTKEMKQRAGEIAKKTLKEINSNDTFENNLIVGTVKQ